MRVIDTNGQLKVTTGSNNLVFGGTSEPLSSTAPTAGQTLEYLNGTWQGIPPLPGYINGLTLANNATQSISIAKGVVTDSTGTYYMFNNTGTYFKSLAGTWAAGAGTSGSPKNGLDTGSAAASTWYHVYAIYNPTSQLTDFIFSTAAPGTGPSLPSGYTVFQRFSSILTDGSKNVVLFYQFNDYFQWNGVSDDVSNQTISAATTFSLAHIPPNVRVSADITVLVSNSSSGVGVWISSPDVSGGFASAPSVYYSALPAGQNVDGRMVVPTNASQQIKASPSGRIVLYVDVNGYFDPRGRT